MAPPPEHQIKGHQASWWEEGLHLSVGTLGGKSLTQEAALCVMLSNQGPQNATEKSGNQNIPHVQSRTGEVLLKILDAKYEGKTLKI